MRDLSFVGKNAEYKIEKRHRLKPAGHEEDEIPPYYNWSTYETFHPTYGEVHPDFTDIKDWDILDWMIGQGFTEIECKFAKISLIHTIPKKIAWETIEETFELEESKQ